MFQPLRWKSEWSRRRLTPAENSSGKLTEEEKQEISPKPIPANRALMKATEGPRGMQMNLLLLRPPQTQASLIRTALCASKSTRCRNVKSLVCQHAHKNEWFQIWQKEQSAIILRGFDPHVFVPFNHFFVSSWACRGCSCSQQAAAGAGEARTTARIIKCCSNAQISVRFLGETEKNTSVLEAIQGLKTSTSFQRQNPLQTSKHWKNFRETFSSGNREIKRISTQILQVRSYAQMLLFFLLL